MERTKLNPERQEKSVKIYTLHSNRNESQWIDEKKKDENEEMKKTVQVTVWK